MIRYFPRHQRVSGQLPLHMRVFSFVRSSVSRQKIYRAMFLNEALNDRTRLLKFYITQIPNTGKVTSKVAVVVSRFGKLVGYSGLFAWVQILYIIINYYS